jgi:hypothetical protein
MDISKLKTKFLGGGDGGSIVLVKGNTAYHVTADGMSDALMRAKKAGIAKTNEWKLTNERAVIIPGVWEFQMATYIGENV